MSEEALKLLEEARKRKCEKHGEHTIELDCSPGSPRPGELILKEVSGGG